MMDAHISAYSSTLRRWRLTRTKPAESQTLFACILFFGVLQNSQAFAADAAQANGEWLSAVRWGLAEAYRAAPALLIGLAIAVALPLLALAAQYLMPLLAPSSSGYQLEPRAPDDIADEPLAHAPQPFLEVEGSNGLRRCAIPRDMVRIGREDDNDIRIRNGAIHRYHAAIHREDYDGWHITDLSGSQGVGLVVNGRRCDDARLHDGDLIELGPGRLRFRAGLAA